MHDVPVRYLLLGAGLQARAIGYHLLRHGHTLTLTVIDNDPERLAALSVFLDDPRVVLHLADAGNVGQMHAHMRQHEAVVNSLPYSFGIEMLKAAISAGCHYCDLGGNDDVTDAQFAMHQEAVEMGVKAFPAAGVAPGGDQPIARYGIDLYRQNTGKYPKRVAIYCGGMQQSPAGPLKHSLTFSVQGLFNEYLEDCEILQGGKLTRVRSLTGLETQEFPGLGEFAAVYTSGGLSTLARTYENLIPELCYKTLRYGGHWSILNMLRDLGFMEMEPVDVDGVSVPPRRVSEAVFEKHLRKYQDIPDMIVLRIVIEGEEGRIVIETVIRSDPELGLSAMQIATGFMAATVIEMTVRGDVTDVGVLRQEVSLDPEIFIEELRRSGIILDVTLPAGWEK